MGWLFLALLSAFFNSLMDFFTKLSSGKIHAGAGAILVCFFAAIPALLYTLVTKTSGQQINISKEGIFYSSLKRNPSPAERIIATFIFFMLT